MSDCLCRVIVKIRRSNMEEFISDWFIPMDFGNDAPEEMPDGEISTELFVQPACSVCEDWAGEYGAFGWCD